jgi:hypothetical protein
LLEPVGAILALGVACLLPSNGEQLTARWSIVRLLACPLLQLIR